MRYVGNEYDDFDDEDDEIEDDADEQDDDGGAPPRSNPFTSPANSGQRSSSLPGAGRSSGLPGSSAPGGSSGGLGSRLPGTPASSGLGQNRPASPSSPSSPSSPPRYGSPSGGSSGSGAPSGPPPRPGAPGSSSSSLSGSGSTSPFGSRYPSSSSPSSPGGSGSPSSAPSRPGSPSSPSSPSGAKPAPPADEKKSGGMLGGLGSRLGGGKGDDKQNKPATPKGSGDKASGGSPLGGIGGNIGGLANRLTNRGGDSGGKPAAPAKASAESAGGGLFGKLRPGAKTEEKKPGTPAASSASRPGGTSPTSSSPFGGGAKPATPGSSPSASSAARSTGEMNRPKFGSAAGGTAPATPKSAAKTADAPSGLSRFLPSFARGGKEDKKPEKKARPSKAPKIQSGTGLSLDHKLDILGVVLVLSSLALFLSSLSSTKGHLTEWANGLLSQTFGWGAVAIPIAMMAVGIWLVARHFGDEAPVVPTHRIIGIVLAYVGVLILMQYIDTYSYINSDGSIVTIDVLQKVWLPLSIARGSGGGWVGANLYFLLASNVTEYGAFLAAVGLLIFGAMFILNISAAELTMIVVSIGRSFADAQQRRAQRRAQAAAPGLEQITAEAAASAPAVTVSKPVPEALPITPPTPALPAASEPALPAGQPVPAAAERNIAINIGGRTSTVPTTGGVLQPVENKPARTAQQPAASAAPRTAEPATAPAGGGLGSRLRGAIPSMPSIPKPNIGLPGSKASGDGAAAPKAEPAKANGLTPEKDGTKMPEKAASPAGGLRGMFSRQKSPAEAEAVPEKPATSKSPVPATTSAASAAPGASTAAIPSAVNAVPASSPLKSPVPQEEPAARLGDLLKPAGQQKPAAPSMPSRSPSAFTPAEVVDKSASAESVSALRSPMSRPPSTISGTATPVGDKDKDKLSPSPFGRPSEPAKPFAAASPAFKSSSVFNAKDLTDDDDIEDKDDPLDEMDDLEVDEDSEQLTKLAPATPKGTGPLPRPNENTSRFAPTTFGANKPAEPAADRQDRLNALRSGNLGGPPVSPTPAKPNLGATKPEDMPSIARQPAAFVGSAPAASTPDKAQPVTPVGASAAPATPATPRATPVSPAPAAPVRPVTLTAASPADKPADGEKKPQPAAAFWKPAAESAKAEPAPQSSPIPKADLPKAPVQPPASSFGRPTTPPGAPPNMMPNTNGGAAPAANAPLPPSPEIALRQPGVGTSAPAGAKRHKEWKLPTYSSLLLPGSEGDIDRESLLRRARIIEDTLNSFGAPGKVVEVNTGPVITQFGVEPDYLVTRGGKKNRVKVSAIAQLDKDIQLALGAKSIRIEAPVPGKGYVGIEVPNDAPSLVSLRDVMESDSFKKIKSPLAIALGQSVDGAPISADLTGMPHLLIAGTTGSGKSVCVNAIISSLILRNPPDRVKFIMVDPKRVELTGYNGIPHLVAPVVVDLERIVGVLKWVTREMDERYKKFSTAGARNIEDYNNHLGSDVESMPYIVVIIDELADLMMLAPDETERVITRIAALARATGIHLVIATQRPSVDVVTGLIKANFPARIAFAVAGGVDSRVILDQPGAERLLGRGDMLYMSGDSPAPLRLQGVYVSDTEINNITRYWKGQMSDDDVASKPISTLVLDHSIAENGRSVMPSNDRQQIQQAFWDRDQRSGANGNGSSSATISSSGGDDDIPDDQEDELYEEAVEMVRRLNKASVSLLQRRLRIGYTRAARLIDRMEEEGIVGPAVEGSKPREVLPLR